MNAEGMAQCCKGNTSTSAASSRSVSANSVPSSGTRSARGGQTGSSNLTHQQQAAQSSWQHVCSAATQLAPCHTQLSKLLHLSSEAMVLASLCLRKRAAMPSPELMLSIMEVYNELSVSWCRPGIKASMSELPVPGCSCWEALHLVPPVGMSWLAGLKPPSQLALQDSRNGSGSTDAAGSSGAASINSLILSSSPTYLQCSEETLAASGRALHCALQCMTNVKPSLGNPAAPVRPAALWQHMSSSATVWLQQVVPGLLTTSQQLHQLLQTQQAQHNKELASIPPAAGSSD